VLPRLIALARRFDTQAATTNDVQEKFLISLSTSSLNFEF
jgi:hypothetical protein